MRACYLDASAIVKLATQEVGTEALRSHLELYSSRVTSRLAAVEVPRALARKGPETVSLGGGQVAQTLEGMMLIEPDEAIALTAAALEPPSLRSIDAIHVASALSIRDELDAFITYDERLADAARTIGLEVVSPG